MRNYFPTLFLLLFFSLPVFACTCAGFKESEKKNVERYFNKAETIFVGNLVSKEFLNKSRKTSSADPVKYTFEIIELIKGDTLITNISIITAASGASCGYNFEEGFTYLVHANKSEQFSKKYPFFFNTVEVLTTGACFNNSLKKNVPKRRLKYYRKLSKKMVTL